MKDSNYINQAAEFYIIFGDRAILGQGYGIEVTKRMIRYFWNGVGS